MAHVKYRIQAPAVPSALTARIGPGPHFLLLRAGRQLREPGQGEKWADAVDGGILGLPRAPKP